jgi:mannose-6-phosphate isomerase-like protein (cupin superfamily)
MFTVIKNTKHPIQKISDEKKSLHELVNLDEKISLNVVEAIDYHEKTTAAFNRIYYISEGLMRLYINNQEIELQKGDACLVEKGMIFELQGTFTVIIVSHPPLQL